MHATYYGCHNQTFILPWQWVYTTQDTANAQATRTNKAKTQTHMNMPYNTMQTVAAKQYKSRNTQKQVQQHTRVRQ